MSSPLMASDVLTFLYDFFIHVYHILLAALRQLVAIFCQRISLPSRTKGPEKNFISTSI